MRRFFRSHRRQKLEDELHIALIEHDIKNCSKESLEKGVIDLIRLARKLERDLNAMMFAFIVMALFAVTPHPYKIIPYLTLVGFFLYRFFIPWATFALNFLKGFVLNNAKRNK